MQVQVQGFFQPSNTHASASKKPVSLIPRCGSCGIYKICKSPKMPITGDGKKGILLIGEAPGAEEDEKNIQFVGRAGQTLRSTLRKFNIDLDRDCWKTNALICRPKNNVTPTSNEIDYCRPNLTSAIEKLKPRIIIPMGGVAVKSLLGPLWREDPGPVSKWVGWKIPLQKYDAWITPTYHPSYINRAESLREGPVIKLWFERHLESAFELEGRPWHPKPIPDYENEIEIVDSKYAVIFIKELIDSKKAFAWDIETNCLKPDSENAEIVCCSISTGNRTIAYAWAGEVIKATGELLQSNNPKIGANIKFESRWIKSKLGIDVKNWVWDCMLSAHHLDNRRGITSVKIQAFLRLGQEDWSSHIKPYLETTDDKGINRIREVNIRLLLIYCGIDAKIEFLIAHIQRKEMKNV